MRSDAPLLHEGRPNVLEAARIVRGDITEAFQRADSIVTTTFRNQRVHQGYIEPRVALAEIDEQDVLLLTCSSQAPFFVAAGVAELLDIPLSRVRVKVPALGGGFGGKLFLGVAPYAAALALRTRRPVQVVASRAEDMQASAPRENSIITLRSAVTADGHIIARRAEVYLDSGAYAYDTPIIAALAAFEATGPYAIESMDVRIFAVSTHTAPTGSMRAPTGPQMVYATELHLEAIARELSVSAIELRRLNFMRRGSHGPTGQVLNDPAIETCFASALDEVERWRASAPNGTQKVGYGIACAWWLTSRGASSATVELNEDGTATVVTGATEIGTGAVSVGIPMVVAETLGLELARVNLVSADTGVTPYDYGSEGSRTLYGAGNAAARAARAARQLLVTSIANHLGIDANRVTLAKGGIDIAGAPELSMPLKDAVALARDAYGPIVGAGQFQVSEEMLPSGALDSPLAVSSFNEPTFHCHATQVEVDASTGVVNVRKYVAVHDVGTPLNPRGVTGQIEGGVVQGLGQALYEELMLGNNGEVLNPSLVDYRMPTIADIPDDLKVVLIADFPSRSGPFGSKGIGEAPILLPAAAVGAAILDAVGALPRELPMSAERLSALLLEPDLVLA